MELRNYQVEVLEALSGYLTKLAEQRREAEEFVEFQKSKGRQVTLDDYCRKTWEALKDRLPRVRVGDQEIVPDYVPRSDGVGRAIPNICLKVPTGGGKTLLASLAIERINTEYFRRQTGLVLWIVPSEAIYSQTWRQLANREHPYRQMLERASGGRVKLLEKDDTFTAQDVDSQLCVMLMMLQAGAVQKKSKDARKMFQNSGKYPSFFPDVDDAAKNEALVKQVPNLDLIDLTDAEAAQYGLMARHSLGNVLRLMRPVVVIDEGHRAYSDTALQTICEYNPGFILELSATPNAEEHISNVVVSVTGSALKSAEMIKLPINVINEGRADWKHALAAAKGKLDELQKTARRVQHNEGRYIRPIMLVRVERTGKDQVDRDEVHADHVKKYLIENLGADETEIKIKSSEVDELEEVQKKPEYKGKGLLSDLCPVRYIITKDALREGWDCPFAYVLAVLSRTKARTAITQMVGRVLRQPDAKLTEEPSLNECYVFTHDHDVQEAVDNVRRGLQEEGMGDLAASVRAGGPGSAAGSRRETLRRREKFKGVQVFMPRILSKHYRTGEWREFDYERDLLSRIDWDRMTYRGRDSFAPDEHEGIAQTLAKVDVDDLKRKDVAGSKEAVTVKVDDAVIDVPALARLLLDVVPNPWQGARVIEQSLAALRRRGFSEHRIFANRLNLVKAIKDDLKSQVNDAGEALFRKMLAGGELSFQLMSSGDPTLNWELATTLEIDVSDEDRVLLRRDGTPLEKSFLEPVYRKQLNELEKEVAWYLDGDQAVEWWHRIAIKQDWHLQGWQRGRIYPDFLICVSANGKGPVKFTVLETKGLYLRGNDDTEYKRKLFELLSEHMRSGTRVGELIISAEKQQIRFDMLLENDWRTKIGAALSH